MARHIVHERYVHYAQVRSKLPDALLGGRCVHSPGQAQPQVAVLQLLSQCEVLFTAEDCVAPGYSLVALRSA